MTYHALGQRRDAATALQTAVDLAGDSALPQFATARDVLAEIGAP